MCRARSYDPPVLAPFTSRRRIALVALALPLLLLTACGSRGSTAGSTTSAAPGPGTTIAVEVAGGSVVGGVQKHSVRLGDLVTIRVTADVADEIHVHGYDLKKNVAAGTPSEITFSADIPGQFEVELEGAGKKLLDLEVS